jgi:two-component system sensor histidine kinase VicK
MPTNDLEILKTAILNAPIGICLLDAKTLTGEIVNSKFLEVAGKPHDAIIGKYYWDAFAEARQLYEPAMDHVIQSGEAYFATEAELPLIRHGKEEIVFVSFVYSPIKNANGTVAKIAVWVLENTVQVKERQKVDTANRKLKVAQEKLQKTFLQLEESEIALRLALSAANFGTWFIHSKTRAFIVDARLKELFGYRPDEEITIEDALAQITDEYREFVANALEDAIYKGGDYDVTYPVIGFHDQQLRWLRAIGNLKADPSGEFSSFTGVVMDITKQKQEEQRKNDFIGMVSHELKTPLASLNAYLQLLQRHANFTSDDFARHSLEQSIKQVKKMTTMINGFLNISRLEAGKIHIDKTWFNMALLFKEIEEESRTMINTHQVIFESLGSIFVNADRDKIGQVISNFISNAVKYSQPGTTIHISCLDQNENIQVCVKDEGVGIHREDLDRLFERYYRAHHNNHIAGFGIGLYLCSEIIQRHEGEIWVKSEAGKGASFYFTLPLVSKTSDSD